jgi:hypothetical protein
MSKKAYLLHKDAGCHLERSNRGARQNKRTVITLQDIPRARGKRVESIRDQSASFKTAPAPPVETIIAMG